MPRSKHDPRERARRSGLGAQLTHFFAANRKAWKQQADHRGPRNPSQMAQWLTARGEPVTYKAIKNWEDGENLPESRFVPLLEELLGAPFLYLDNPANEPVSDRKRLTFLAGYAGAPADRARAEAALRALADGDRARRG